MPDIQINKDKNFCLVSFSWKSKTHPNVTNIGYVNCIDVATPTSIYAKEVLSNSVVVVFPKTANI
jgi:hypothetical protein